MDSVREEARDIPVMGDADVVVVGGGIAGVSAALAASRVSGTRVWLLERSFSLGGLATIGNVIYFLPICDGMGRQVIGGIGEELLRLSVKDAERFPTDISIKAVPPCWEKGGSLEERKKARFRTAFNPVTYMIKLERLMLKNHVKLLYDTRFCGVVKEGGHLRALLVETKAGRLAIRCKAVVDCSGDADVCFAAGEKTQSIGGNVRCGWYYYIDKDGHPRLRTLTDPIYREKRLAAGIRVPVYRGDSAEQVTAQTVASRQLLLEDLERIRQNEGGAPYPIMAPTMSTHRMTRRLVGKVTLKPSDDHRWFEDTLGMTGDWRKAGPIFCIPLRALAARNTANLITAGRCISSVGDTWDVTRVIPTCAVTGEAAGIAAAFLSHEQEDLGFCDLELPALQNAIRRKKGIIDKQLLENYGK